MVFRSSRRSQAKSTDAAGRAARQQQSTSQRKQSTGAVWTSNTEQAEQHYGMTIPDDRTLQRLRIAEDTYGQQVHEWVDEGMPADILGKTRSMEEFRQRQADRPPEVPTNIERRHRRSVLRSEQAAADTGSVGETGVPEPVGDVLSSTGRSLDASIQRAMEDRMGDSLGDVRIHTGPQAAAACEAINARAFTVGNHVAFNQGEYDPDSPEGQHVLAHELAHVRQQTGGAVSMLPQAAVELEVDPDPQLEREAEEAAQQVMEDGPVVVNRMGTEMHIQRSVKDALSSVAEQAPGIGGNDRGGDDELGFQDLDDGDLAETVGTLVENQQEIISQIQPGHERQSLIEQLGKATGKGAIGAAGGLVGAAAGTLIAPGVGTASGAVAGQQLVSQLSSSIVSDVSKAAYDPVFEAGTDAITKQASDFSAYLDDLVDEKLRQRFGGAEHSGETVAGEGGYV